MVWSKPTPDVEICETCGAVQLGRMYDTLYTSPLPARIAGPFGYRDTCERSGKLHGHGADKATQGVGLGADRGWKTRGRFEPATVERVRMLLTAPLVYGLSTSVDLECHPPFGSTVGRQRWLDNRACGKSVGRADPWSDRSRGSNRKGLGEE